MLCSLGVDVVVTDIHKFAIHLYIWKTSVTLFDKKLKNRPLYVLEQTTLLLHKEL